MRFAQIALPLFFRLRDSGAALLDHLGFGLAVVLGLTLATWLCAALGSRRSRRCSSSDRVGRPARPKPESRRLSAGGKGAVAQPP